MRGVLRSRFGIEAAVGSFAPSAGHRSGCAASPAGTVSGVLSGAGIIGCVRLSHAVYSAPAEFDALRDAVLELAEEAKRR